MQIMMHLCILQNEILLSNSEESTENNSVDSSKMEKYMYLHFLFGSDICYRTSTMHCWSDIMSNKTSPYKS